MHDDHVLERLAEFDTPSEAVPAFLYRGMVGSSHDPLHASGYDGCLWLAYSPTVAQTYIPASSSTLLRVSSWSMDDLVRPQLNCTPPRPDGLYALAVQLGYPEAENIEFDRLGRADSWRTPPGYPKYGDLVRHLVGMGYPWEEGRDFSAWVRIEHVEGRDVFRPNGFKKEGRLFVIDGVSDLRLYDHAAGSDGDLMDVDYHKLKLFREVEAEGYDGIVINDFCQTDNHGNVGHRSVGLFEHAIPKIRYASVPAVHWEWPEDERCSALVTPEFEQAHETARSAFAMQP